MKARYTMSAGRVWKTEKARLLDSEEYRTASQRVSGAGIPGTGKRFNSETVATQITDIVVAELDEPGRGINIETALTALGRWPAFPRRWQSGNISSRPVK
jgi:hypothetical protein